MPDYRELLAESRILRFYGVHIDGIEVTQSIQYYHASEHLTSETGKDNSIRLIAHKPAYARVYVRSGLLHGDVPNITGQLEIMRRSKSFTYDLITTLFPIAPGSVTARQSPSYDQERSNLLYSLNFIIPPRSSNFLSREVTDIMCGSLRLRATIQTTDGRTDALEVDLNVTLEQTLRLRGILVSYSGPSSSAANAPTLNLPAPTLANLQANAALTLSMFPVQSKGVYSSGGTIALTQHLQDNVAPGGGCSANWNALLTQLQAQRVADGNRSDWVYYGLLPAATPVGNTAGTNSGCGRDGLGAGAVGFGLTMAHELGHACGLQHAPCGSVGSSADANYPAYTPYDAVKTPQASIGEYGLDVSNGTIFSPATVKDLMSYCNNSNWISLYNYGLLLDNSHLSPKSVCRNEFHYDDELYDPWWWLPWRLIPDPGPEFEKQILNMQPVISVIGVIHNETQIEIKSVMRLDANTTTQTSRLTEYIAELVGIRGNVVARAQIYALAPYGNCGCGCDDEGGKQKYPYVFQAFLPDTETGVEIIIRSGEKTIWSRKVSDSEPKVTHFRAHVSDGELFLQWEVDAKCESPEIWVQWRKRESEIWQALSTNPGNHKTSFDLSLLPSGLIELRLLISDGFSTGQSERVVVEVPERPPVVSILHPRERQTIPVGTTIHLWGAAQGSNQEEIEDQSASWVLDGREIEIGFDAFIEAPEAGEHNLYFIVSTQKGRSEKGITFRTININADNKTSQSETK